MIGVSRIKAGVLIVRGQNSHPIPLTQPRPPPNRLPPRFTIFPAIFLPLTSPDTTAHSATMIPRTIKLAEWVLLTASEQFPGAEKLFDRRSFFFLRTQVRTLDVAHPTSPLHNKSNSTQDVTKVIERTYPLPPSQKERPRKTKAACLMRCDLLESMDPVDWARIFEKSMFNHISAYIDYSNPVHITIEVNLCINEDHKGADGSFHPSYKGSER